jgi:hypothetical protein
LRGFENRVLGKIYVARREEAARSWRRLHNEELHNLYGSSNISRVIKPRSMRWTRHVARMRETRNMYKILGGKPAGKNH